MAKHYESVEQIQLMGGESKAAKFVADDGTEHVFMVSLSTTGEVTVITDDMSITAECSECSATTCGCADECTHLRLHQSAQGWVCDDCGQAVRS
jgi:hypothetical protein